MADDGKGAKPKHYGVNPSLSGFGEFSIISTVAAIASQIRGGGDLTSITLPSCFCEPVTILEVLAYKRIRGMHYLTELKNLDHPLERALTILKWYLAPNTQDPYGKKPLNPILGETFRCQDHDKEWIYVSEQISHHPPISAFHFDHVSENIQVFGNAHVQAIMGAGYVAAGIKGPAIVRVDLAKNQKPRKAAKKHKKHKKSSKAEGESESSSAEPDVDSDTMTDPDSSLSQKKKKKSSKSSHKHEESPDATASSSSSDDVEGASSEAKAPKKKKKKSSRSSEPEHDPIIEEYILDPSLPMGYARGLLAGSRFNELVGNVCIRCPQTKFEIHIEFTKAGWIWGEPHMVVGYIKHPDYSEKILKFQGKWTETIKVKKVHPDFKEIVDKFLPKDGIAFDQEALELVHYDDIHLIGSSTENKCSRAIWHDTNIGIRAGDLAVADTAKKIVEDRQRQYHKDMQNGVIEHKLRFFKPDDGLVKWIINRDADLDAE